MTEERVTAREARGSGDTTIIRETRSGGGAGWVIAIILVVALVAGIWLFNRYSSSETAKNNAITAAAQNVGNSARDVGDAARDVGDAAQGAAKDAAPKQPATWDGQVVRLGPAPFVNTADRPWRNFG